MSIVLGSYKVLVIQNMWFLQSQSRFFLFIYRIENKQLVDDEDGDGDADDDEDAFAT
jgi:hypothetical protein